MELKVNIGKYPSYSYFNKWNDIYLKVRYPEYDYFNELETDRFDLFVNKFFNFLDSVYRRFQKKEQRVSVNIDSWDTWSLYQTLASVIYPALVKYKNSLHGSPRVDDEDVPENIRSSSAPKVKGHETDEFYFMRWQWVLDEMIWTFRELESGADEMFFHNADNLKMDFIPLENGYNQVKFEYQHDLSKPKYFVDEQSRKWYNDKIQNGLRLFGKYYRDLWT